MGLFYSRVNRTALQDGSSIPPAHTPPKQLSPTAKWLIVLGVIAAVILLIGLSIVASVSDISSELEALSTGSELKEQIISAAKGKDSSKLAVINISEPILGSGSAHAGEGLLYEASRRLRRAAKDDNVKGVLLQIDSPGGSIAASDIIHNEIKKLRAQGKPVVVSVGALAASGGYYIACASDWIIATPTALIGSIGVIIQHLDVRRLLDKVGINADPIKSSEMKDIGSPFRTMTDRERDFFQSLVDTYYEQFVTIVSEGRSLDVSMVKSVADGRVFTAGQAHEYNLIDQVGYYDDAVEKLREIAGAPDAALVKYSPGFDLRGLLSDMPFFRSDRDIFARDWIEQITIEAAVPRVWALWTGPVTAE